MNRKKFLSMLCVVCICALSAVSAFATSTPSASDVITSMTTGLTAAQGNIISMVNSVVPVGVGVYAVTAAIRVGKRMFVAAGGNGR